MSCHDPDTPEDRIDDRPARTRSRRAGRARGRERRGRVGRRRWRVPISAARAARCRRIRRLGWASRTRRNQPACDRHDRLAARRDRPRPGWAQRRRVGCGPAGPRPGIDHRSGLGRRRCRADAARARERAGHDVHRGTEPPGDHHVCERDPCHAGVVLHGPTRGDRRNRRRADLQHRCIARLAGDRRRCGSTSSAGRA